jgi:dephospho-CoA kinase
MATPILEIPLLYETGGEALFDAVIVVSAPEDVQRARMMERPGMTAGKLEAIIARQWPDGAKREKADFVVDTGVPLEDTYRQIDAVVKEIQKRPPLAFQRWANLLED